MNVTSLKATQVHTISNNDMPDPRTCETGSHSSVT